MFCYLDQFMEVGNYTSRLSISCNFSITTIAGAPCRLSKTCCTSLQFIPPNFLLIISGRSEIGGRSGGGKRQSIPCPVQVNLPKVGAGTICQLVITSRVLS
ncbi:hypothetical protein DdX_09083 [Ditylenchus destructor]|uniref:Uncharacterized protein n=1 Tax=Ditylenchus destructor TaxID=166010 RepID=A0AAD4N2S2_9BILA|nr:hypothetical protein DdX_09083 [Ditylenchus destructor]